MSGLVIGGATLGAAGLNYLAADKAGDQQASAADRSAAQTKEMFDISRGDMLPFLESAVGAPSDFEEYQLWSGLPVGMKAGSTPWGVGDVLPNQEKITRVEDVGGGLFNVYGQRPAIDPTTGRIERQPGALDLYQKGIAGAQAVPTVPGAVRLDEFTPGFAERGSRFAGDRFSYDPYEAMESPDIQFLREQGEQGLKRSLAGNRKLGSGNRLLDFIKYNQGLASTGLQDYFNRQYQMNRENYGRALGEDELAYGRGLTERGIDIEDYNREAQRQIGNRDRELQARLAQYQLDTGADDTRMNRLLNLIKTGAGAAGATSEGALATGRSLSDIYGSMGASDAAATLGKFGAINQGIGNAAYLDGMTRPNAFTCNYSPYTPRTNELDIGFNPSATNFFG